MKIFVILLLTSSALSLPIEVEDDFEPNQALVNTYLYGEPNPEWLKYVNDDGVFDPSLVEPGHEIPRQIIEPETQFTAETDVVFYLYTKRETTRRQIILENLNSIQQSTFDPSKPIRIIVHGWQNDDTADAIQLVKNAYLQKGDYNVFSVDWGKGANTIDYTASRNRVGPVAEVVARFIDFIVSNTGATTSQMQIIGHSLGAHISGLTGKNLKTGKIPVIIGLDPALPLFSLSNSANRLAVGDATYVEIIHTNGGTLGFDDPIGNADFYPNYGRSQPGCGIDLTGSCAHGRAYEFLAESITTSVGFWSKQCGSYDQIKNKNCVATGKTALLGGEPISTSKASGVYYVQTNANKPYAMGQ